MPNQEYFPKVLVLAIFFFRVVFIDVVPIAQAQTRPGQYGQIRLTQTWAVNRSCALPPAVGTISMKTTRKRENNKKQGPQENSPVPNLPGSPSTELLLSALAS